MGAFLVTNFSKVHTISGLPYRPSAAVRNFAVTLTRSRLLRIDARISKAQTAKLSFYRRALREIMIFSG